MFAPKDDRLQLSRSTTALLDDEQNKMSHLVLKASAGSQFEGAREQIPRLSITAAVRCLRRQLELAAQHADNVVGGDDAGELVVIVDHR